MIQRDRWDHPLTWGDPQTNGQLAQYEKHDPQNRAVKQYHVMANQMFINVSVTYLWISFTKRHFWLPGIVI